MKELELRITSYFGVQLDLDYVNCDATTQPSIWKYKRMQFVDIRAKEDVQRDTEIKDERGGESKSKGDSEEEFPCSSSLQGPLELPLFVLWATSMC